MPKWVTATVRPPKAFCERFVSRRRNTGIMTDREKAYSRPERILLLVARRHGDCRGKAVRIADDSEFRFDSVGELARWLLKESPAEPGTDTGED